MRVHLKEKKTRNCRLWRAHYVSESSSFNEKETASSQSELQQTLQGKGQDKSIGFRLVSAAQTLRILAEATECGATWEATLSKEMHLHAGALLHPPRGPFLKIEELNLWYNFRSKNNRKRVLTGDCHVGWL